MVYKYYDDTTWREVEFFGFPSLFTSAPVYEPHATTGIAYNPPTARVICVNIFMYMQYARAYMHAHVMEYGRITLNNVVHLMKICQSKHTIHGTRARTRVAATQRNAAAAVALCIVCILAQRSAIHLHIHIHILVTTTSRMLCTLNVCTHK